MKRLVAKFTSSATAAEKPRGVEDQKAVDRESKNPTPKPSAGHQSSSSGLERLPPEVRRHILSILDLPRLKVLILASPTFHRQYLLDRRYLLCKSLEETLGSVAVDAYAVHMSETQGRDAKQNIPGLLKLEYAIPRSLSITMDKALSMVIFYFHSVKPVVDHYARCIIDNLDNLAKEAGRRTQGHRQEITRTEAMRLTRAAYRFQLLCQVADPVDNAIRLSRERTVEAFLNTLEPWEIEELFSFYQFVGGVYDRILDNIRWDLHQSNSKFDDQSRPPTPEGAFNLDISVERDSYLEGLTLRGLPLLNTVLFRIKDHQHLVSTIQQHMVSSYIPFNAAEGVLGETQQALRRESCTSERDRKQDQRFPFPFRGDGEPDAPPLAWTIIWGDTYSSLYGSYISDEMRRWGYVFWDATTLEGAMGREILERQWEEYWGGDPRDNLI